METNAGKAKPTKSELRDLAAAHVESGCINVVLAGDLAHVPAAEGARYRDLVKDALAETGERVEGWELRDGAGAVVDLDDEISSRHREWYSRLFLNRRPGWGG